ncbi:MAG: hypothetical protein L6R37_008439, partial [Teloschistes peruensis]
RGVSDQQRNQILGHARSDTFLKHYISSNVVVDVQATFLGTASRADLIKEIGKLCLRRDPNLPKQLSDHQRTQACQRPDIIRIQQEKDALAQKLKNDFGTIKNGSQSPDGIQYTRVKKKLRASKMLAEREAFTKLLRDFHSTADLDHMVTQFNGEEPASQMLDPVQHILEERRQLAHDLFQPAAVSSFAQMVETMARLCLLSEGKDHRYSGHKGDNADRTIASYACTQPSSAAVDEHVYSADSIDLALDLNGVQPLENAKPTKTVKSTMAMKLATSSKVTKAKKSLTSRTCLFCYGNPKRGRTESFARPDSLRRHYRRAHFQYQIGPFPCPLLECRKIINDSDQFANHAVTMHRSDLGARAIIKEALGRTAKHGQLASFTL